MLVGPESGSSRLVVQYEDAVARRVLAVPHQDAVARRVVEEGVARARRTTTEVVGVTEAPTYPATRAARRAASSRRTR